MSRNILLVQFVGVLLLLPSIMSGQQHSSDNKNWAEKGVVIRPSFCEAMKSLEKEDQLDLFWAICDYGIYGAEPQGCPP